jgi:crotonobetainyl-CoA:carnitine CoA-transferase CaiB-like acyl-CoA transferase
MGLQPCRDGWVCIGTASPPQWEHFCLAIDMPELLADPRFTTGGDRFDHADALDGLIAPWLRERSRDEVVSHLQRHRVPASRVLSLTELLGDPQLAARSFWDTPSRLGAGARMPGIPFRIDERGEPFREAPRLGEHTLAVLARAGFAGTEIDRLVDAGIVAPAGTVS